jgi:phenylacetate-coenzyme A ligase PaaK-like adenylate-forming protein
MRIERVEGRLADTVRRSDGSLVPYWAFGTSVIWSHPSVAGIVRQWRVVLESPRRLVLEVVTDGPLTDAGRAHLTRAMHEAIGAGVDVVIAEVDHLDLESNGKFKPVRVVG